MSARIPSATDHREQVDVLALIDHFVLGGAETLLSRFALAAPSVGIRLTTACLTDFDGNPAAAPLEQAGIPPVNLHLDGRPGPHALRAVRRHIESVGPQIVHTHLGSADLLGSIAARSLGLPAISTIHASRWPERQDRIYRRLVAPFVTRVIAVSESARQEYIARGLGRPDRVVTIHNGVDVTPRPGEGGLVRRELGLGSDDLVLVMVSALREEKAHDVAIAAVRQLRSRFPHLRLVIAGQGRMHDEILRSSRDLNDAVVLAGLRPDVMRVLDAADVCVHPSHHEAFPTTILEAMAAGVPVVASAVGGIPEIITNDELGVLVPPPPRADTLSAALADLLARPERRAQIASAGRRSYEQRFTGSLWVTRTRALYDHVLAERARTRRRPRLPGAPDAASARHLVGRVDAET